MKIIKINGCGECPYNAGWDPYQSKDLKKEAIFCAYERMTKGPGKDRVIGYFDRSQYINTAYDTKSGVKDVPIPRWCPLPEDEK